MSKEPRAHGSHVGRGAVRGRHRLQAVDILGVRVRYTNVLRKCADNFANIRYRRSEAESAEG